LLEAVRSGTIASRTTKSDIRMAAPPSLVAGFLGGLTGAGHVADRGGAAAVLDLLLVAAQLRLKFGQGEVHGGEDLVVALVGDEVVLVLGLDDELDPALVLDRLAGTSVAGASLAVDRPVGRPAVADALEVDGDLDQRQSVEQVGELVGFFAD